MTTIGRVDFTVDFDGNTLPTQARRIGERLGRTLSQATGRYFVSGLRDIEQRFTAQMGRIGRRGGNALTGSVRKAITTGGAAIGKQLDLISSDSDRAGSALQRLASATEEWGQVTLRNSDGSQQLVQQMRRLTLTFDDVGSASRGLNDDLVDLDGELKNKDKDTSRVTRTMGRFARALRGADANSKPFFKTWRSLPHGFRQFTFYVALFSALGSQISILGSAAGSSLFLILGAIVALLPAIAVLAVGIGGIAQDLDKLPSAVRPVGEALRGLGDDFGALRDNVTVALFEGLAGPISRLANGLIPALNDGLVLTAGTMNGLLERLLEFVNSAPFLENLTAVFAAIQPIIENLAVGLGNLLAALGNVFIVSLPYLEDFSEGFRDLFGQFLAFTQSVEGQTAIAEWFANGQQIIAAILPLLGAAAGVLNGLVTPQTIALFEQLMDNLTTFLEVGGAGILNFLAVLDPIGLIGQALADLSTALAPAGPAFNKIAGVLNGALSEAISTLAPMIGDLVVAIAPLLVTFVEIAAAILGYLLPALQPLIDAIVAAVPAFAPLIDQLASALMPVFLALVPVIIELAASLIPIIIQILPVLVDLVSATAPVLKKLTDLLVILIPIIGGMLGSAIQTVIGILGNFMPLIDAVMQTLGGFLDFIVGVFTGDWKRAWKGLTDIVGGQVNAMIGLVEGLINTVIDLINNLIRNVNNVSKALGLPPIGELGKLSFGTIAFASGGIVTAATRALVGERGPEAIVPLNRPLGMVDPRVRELSAIAQGKSTTYNSSNQRSVVVERGAFQIVGVKDPMQAADATLDRLVARTSL
jgi:phage-related protein